jgi:hypothetical protein
LGAALSALATTLIANGHVGLAASTALAAIGISKLTRDALPARREARGADRHQSWGAGSRR